jgi:hypothetical protein
MRFVRFMIMIVRVRGPISAVVKQQCVLCVFAEVHVIVNNTTIVTFAQKCCYDEFVSLLIMKGP